MNKQPVATTTGLVQKHHQQVADTTYPVANTTDLIADATATDTSHLPR